MPNQGQQQGQPYCQRQAGSKLGNGDRSTCPKCGKSYQHMHHMLRHCKLECGSPPRFQCPYCGMRSKQSNNVYKHIRSKHPGMNLEVIVLDYDQQ
nr:zinc finger X-chromosomal protein-like [Megalopta genalis]